MIECEFAPNPGVVQNLTWDVKYSLQKLVREKISRFSKDLGKDSTLLYDSISCHIKEGKSQKMSFFVTGENHLKNYFSPRQSIGYLDLDYNSFVQSRLASSCDNQFKKIWMESVEPALKAGAYTNYEGKEGALVIAFLATICRDLNESNLNKRNNAGSEFFSNIVGAMLGNQASRHYAFDISHFIKYEGEWYCDQPLDIEIGWMNDEPLSLDLSFKLTPALITEIENSVKDSMQDMFFKHATSNVSIGSKADYSNNWNKCPVISQAINFMLPVYNKLDGSCNTSEVVSPYFNSVTVGGNLFYEESGCSKTTTHIVEKAAEQFKLSRARSLTNDFIRMAHTGGFSQSFDKGKLMKFRSRSTSIARSLNVRRKSWDNKDDGDAVTFISFAYNRTSTCDISISDIVNSILEIYAFAEMSSKENE